MNKKNIENLIPIALDYLSTDQTIIDQTDNKVRPSCATHMKAFGPSIRQAGIVKTIAFYMKDKKNEEDQARKNIAEFVKEVLQKGGYIEEEFSGKNLLDIYIQRTATMTMLEKRMFNKRILEAIVACKLALLTYKEDNPKEKAHEVNYA